MDVQAIGYNCNLELYNVYIEKIEFLRTDSYSIKDQKLDFILEPEIKISDDNKKCKCIMNAEIVNKENKSLDIKIIIVGIFGLLDFEKLKSDTRNKLVLKNTLAIIFPYLRSFITTITSQSGIKPIILPPVNISALVNSQSQNSNQENNS